MEHIWTITGSMFPMKRVASLYGLYVWDVYTRVYDSWLVVSICWPSNFLLLSSAQSRRNVVHNWSPSSGAVPRAYQTIQPELHVYVIYIYIYPVYMWNIYIYSTPAGIKKIMNLENRGWVKGRLRKMRYDLIWFDMIWYVLICFDMFWYVLIWFDMIWYDLICFDMIWYALIWFDMIWYDLIWFDMIWYDLIWFDMIWYVLIFWCD